MQNNSLACKIAKKILVLRLIPSFCLFNFLSIAHAQNTILEDDISDYPHQEYLKEISVQDYRDIIARTKAGRYPAQYFHKEVGLIIYFVESGKFTWEELGTSEEELYELLRQTYVNEYKDTIAKMRGGTYSSIAFQ